MNTASAISKNDRVHRSLALLWQARRVIAKIVVAAALLSAAVSLVLPPTFEAKTKIFPAQTSRGADLSKLLGTADASILAGFTGMPQAASSSNRFLALLQSRVIADRIISQFDLMRIYGAKYHHEARAAL